MTTAFVPVPSPFTHATFAPLLGQAFVAMHADAPVPLELVEARVIELKPMDGRALGKSGFVRRDPFVLLFRGPLERPLPQGLRMFTHAQLGTIELHIVPVGPGATGLLYEAVFN
ncbi:MAG: hypothetical protein U1F48_19435 [Burkholderiales bacterium]